MPADVWVLIGQAICQVSILTTYWIKGRNRDTLHSHSEANRQASGTSGH